MPQQPRGVEIGYTDSTHTLKLAYFYSSRTHLYYERDSFRWVHTAALGAFCSKTMRVLLQSFSAESEKNIYTKTNVMIFHLYGV